MSNMQTKIHFAFEEDWIGRSINGESSRSDTLRQALLHAQNCAIDEVDVQHARQLTLRWEVEDSDGRWHWNPQTPLHSGITTITCVAEWEQE